MRGKKLLLAVGFLSLFGCRSSTPPKIDICIGDGMGGADCSLKKGSMMREKCSALTNGGFYCPPSVLLNMWMTTQPDMEAWSSWCFDTSILNTQSGMRALKTRIQSP